MPVAINLVVGFSLLLAIIFTLAWLLNRNFRESIERPKFQFLENITEFDKALESRDKS